MFPMIRFWLRRLKRTFLRHAGFYTLYDQNALIIQLNEALLRLTHAEGASTRARLAAVHETSAAVLQTVESLRATVVRLVEDGMYVRYEHVDRVVTEEARRVCSLLEAQVQGIDTALANHVAPILSWDLDRWKIQEYMGLIRFFRRKEYFSAIGDGRLEVPRLETQYPVAIASNDTKFPRGSKNDNSIALRFNHKLYEFLSAYPRLRVLDLGCAGGGFVRSLIDDGHFAVGLEGSDYPLRNQTGEWATIPRHLFTCDITKPFQLLDEATGEPLQFEAITAWELMEHIPEDGLGGLLENIDRHLAPEGRLLLSIATFLDWDQRTGTVWHVTVKPREWWKDRFAQHGFVIDEQHPFDEDDWLRGSGQCRSDWHEDAGLGFHVVLRRKTAGALPQRPSQGWLAPVA
jgi:SAM-dependent methyltransferase